MRLDHIKLPLQKLFAERPVAFAYVFGSQATGQTHPESDLDIAVEFTKMADRNHDEMLDELVSIISTTLEIPEERIDIHEFSRLPLPARFRVLRDGQLISIKDVAYQRTLALKTLTEYHEEAPFFRRATQEFLKRQTLAWLL